MISPSFEIRTATRDEMNQTMACIVAAFITDPLARFAWPSSGEYLHAMLTVAITNTRSGYQDRTEASDVRLGRVDGQPQGW